ncbi:BioY protein [Truepera radiovictrix DSM 17093]|uniref:Biotin transporter n=2 Tax=Truepera TaxID=332248 RepID=D7CTW6_TRURR|nr:biotin transporter BioY [Truepera radiovictrix]ADI15663.1 BioY protein [Truepera radiovictrix DSM 17093]WMT58709.1 biotin transporter BioY [Truepera radiovictrix]
MTQTLTPPLIDALVPVRRAALRVPLQLALGVLLMALLAQVRLEIGPVPITGQTLGVLLLGAAYGLRLGALTMLLYLLAGGFGVGVFAGGGSGWSHFSGTTAGYLLAFPVAAAVVGYLAQRGLDRRVSSAALAMALGNLLIYLPGLWWLSTFAERYAPAGTSALAWTLSVGLYPFIAGDLIKLALAAALLPLAWRLLGYRR